MNYYDAIEIISGSKEYDDGLIQKNLIYIGVIVPNRVVEKKQIHEITFLHELFVIKGFEVVTENDKVSRVMLFGYHPNCENGLYCLPQEKKGLMFTEDYFNMLKSNIRTYYLDSCYFRPPSELLTYKGLKSMYVQLNQGE